MRREEQRQRGAWESHRRVRGILPPVFWRLPDTAAPARLAARLATLAHCPAAWASRGSRVFRNAVVSSRAAGLQVAADEAHCGLAGAEFEMLSDTARSVVPTAPAKPDSSATRTSGGSGASGESGTANDGSPQAWKDGSDADLVRNSDESAEGCDSSGVASSRKRQSGETPRPNVHSRASKFHGDIAQKELSSSARKSIAGHLAHSAWYHSSMADRLRIFLLGRTVTSIMSVALLVALFLPDLYVIFGGNADLPVDVALSFVMFLFLCELVALSAVDASYLLSFFFFMDLVGTFCMIFDLSFTGIGSSHEKATEISGSDEGLQKNAMLLRATRAAKVGARAGRLSRVLRILQFVPFLTKMKEDTSQRTALGSAISHALSNLLATRVASLTIMLVMVIPLFEMLSWPQADYSMRAWTQRLSTMASMGLDAELTIELGMMVDYYSSRTYGPYLACKGLWDSGESSFDCQDSISGWDPLFDEPNRGASTYLIHTDNFMVSFNMHEPLQVEAGCSMATMVFVIFIMVFSGMALSSVVNTLAVRPLERMLTTVRTIAITVFKFSAEVNDADREADPEDINGSSEVKLLEKVVQKLAVIADLQTQRKDVEIDEDMRDEDKGILSMMQGKDVVEEAARFRKVSVAIPRKKALEPLPLGQ